MKKEKRSTANATTTIETNVTTNTRSTRSKASKKDAETIVPKPKIIKIEKQSKQSTTKKNSVESIYEDASAGENDQMPSDQNIHLFNSYVVIEKIPSNSNKQGALPDQPQMDATYVSQSQVIANQTYKMNNTVQVQDQTFKIPPSQSVQEQTFKIPTTQDDKDETDKISAHSVPDQTYNKISDQREQDENHSLLTEDNSCDEIVEIQPPVVNKKKKNELFK